MVSEDRIAAWRPHLISVLVALAALAPYAATTLPFKIGLFLQSGVLGLTLGVLSWLMGGSLDFRIRMLPAYLRWGIAVYGCAAVWGVLIGAMAGNPIRYVASQGVAMLFLPVGVLAVAGGPASASANLLRGLAIAIVIGVTLQLVVPLAFPSVLVNIVESPFRFVWKNDIGMGGLVPLVSLLFLGAVLARRGPLWAVPLAASVILLLGSFSRGAWLATAVGALILAVMLLFRSPRFAAWPVGGFTAVVCLVGTSIWVIGSAPVQGPALLLTASGENHEGVPITDIFPPKGGALKWDATPPLSHALSLIGVAISYEPKAGSGVFYLCLTFESEKDPITTLHYPLGGNRRSGFARWIIRAPAGSRTVRAFLVTTAASGSWHVGPLHIWSISNTFVAYASDLRQRLVSMFIALVKPSSDPNVSYRIAEAHEALRIWASSGYVRWLVGAGLGATFDFANSSWDDNGSRIITERASYLHNFYLFLGWKLGIMGVSAFAGLLVIGYGLFREARRQNLSAINGWLPAATFAAWCTYLVWSVSSPELYDFRVAPMWGITLGLVVGSAKTPTNDVTGEFGGVGVQDSIVDSPT